MGGTTTGKKFGAPACNTYVHGSLSQCLPIPWIRTMGGKKYQRRVDSEGMEDKGGDEEEREQVQEEEEEEEEEHLEDDEAPGAFLPGLLLLSLFHHRGCVARKSHAHDSSSQILQSKKLLKVHLCLCSSMF